MIINIDVDTQMDFDFDVQKQLEDLTNKTLDIENLKNILQDFEVSVVLCDNNTIREINNSYRNIDKETDVLSFPMLEFDSPSVIKEEYQNDMENVLGDIVISIPKSKEQAKEYGHSDLREFSFLFIHGLLHILGYDHIEDDDRILMENKQKEILSALNILR